MASTVAVGTSSITFNGSAGAYAIARNTLSFAPAEQVKAFSLRFEVQRNAVTLKIGSALVGQDIINEVTYEPGLHVLSFVPNVAIAFVEFTYRGGAIAKIVNLGMIPAGDLVLDTPWDEAHLRTLRHAQSLNAMWFTSSKQDVEPYVLERRGSATWSLRPFRPTNGPFRQVNLSDVTMTSSALTGIATVTSSEPAFSTKDVGSLIKLVHPGQTVIDTLGALAATSGSVRVSGIGVARNVQLDVTGVYVGTVMLQRSVGTENNFVDVQVITGATTYNDAFDNAVIYYRLKMTAWTSGAATAILVFSNGSTDGIGRIIDVTADNTATIDIIKTIGQTTATPLWFRAQWSARGGYPASVALEDGRLWFGRNNIYWGSASDTFDDFQVGTLADDAMSRTIGGRMNTIQWMLGVDGRLLTGTSGAEANIGSTQFDEVLTPSNVRSRIRSEKGSADHQATQVDDSAVFISRSRERLYQFAYVESRQNYDVGDLTRLNRDIGRKSRFVEVSYQAEPEPRVWATRADGSVAVFVYEPREGVVAPCRLVWDGKVKSVCILPGVSEDQVYLAVERMIGGVPTIGLEILAAEEWDDVRDAWRLHAALRYSGVPKSTFSNLGHLEGLDVWAWADGAAQGPFPVVGGSITLTAPASVAIIGRLNKGRYKSAKMPGTIQEQMQVTRLGLMFHETAGGAVRFGRDFANMDRISDSLPGTVFNGTVEIFEGEFDFPFNGATERDPRICLELDTPGPSTILGLGPLVKGGSK